MSKAKNNNIRKIDKFFINKLDDLRNRIEIEDSDIKAFKKYMLTPWFEEYHKRKGDSEKESWAHNNIKRLIGILNGNKAHRKELIKKYTELKYIHKTMHRALEERWMDGFADGVRFVLDCYDTGEEDK